MNCSRCGNRMNPTGRWENTWPLYGKIIVGFSAQIFRFLAGHDHAAASKLLHDGHPSMTKNEAQEVVFEWSYNSKEYRLCYACQEEFLQTIGKFFEIGE